MVSGLPWHGVVKDRYLATGLTYLSGTNRFFSCISSCSKPLYIPVRFVNLPFFVSTGLRSWNAGCSYENANESCRLSRL